MRRNNIKTAKFKKVFTTFGEGIDEIITCKPQLEKYILPDNYLGLNASGELPAITMDEFVLNFPSIIANKNPLEKDEKGYLPNRLWEYHLSSHKFHIKTNAYFSFGMNYAKTTEGEDSFCFYITLFGNYAMDKAYLIDNGWEELDDNNNSKAASQEDK